MTDPLPSTPGYNPVTANQTWQNEPGFIDSFQNPSPTTASGALEHGGVGLGAGLAGGALTGHSPWFTGLNTGVGSTLGYLLAHTLARNSAPHLQDSYNTFGSLVGGGIGLGGSMLMHDKVKKKELGVSIPGGLELGVKTANLGEMWHNIQGQLPNIRLPDSIVGGGLGAGAGALYDAFANSDGLTRKEKRKNTWSRVLGGAGIGALGGNVVGDRFRRYVSNKIAPYGYDPNSKALSIMPNNFGEVWEGGVMDRPLQPAVKEYLAGKYQPAFTPDERNPFHSTAREMTARWEALRRGMNVHTSHPSTDIWKNQTDGSISLNPQHPDASNLLKEMMYPRDDFNKHLMLKQPGSAAGQINSSNGTDYNGLMSSITGGQRIADYPYENAIDDTKPDHLLKVQDKQTYGLRTNEQKDFMDFIKGRFIHRDPSVQLAPGNSYGINSGESQVAQKLTPDEQTKAVATSYLKRMALQHVLMKNPAWIGQRSYFKKLPINQMNRREDTGYAMVPTTADGEQYNVPEGVMLPNLSGASPRFSYPKDIMSQLQQNTYVPPVEQP